MAGHGSPPAPDRGNHPGRQVGRTSGLRNLPLPAPGSSIRHEPITKPLARYFSPHETEEYKP